MMIKKKKAILDVKLNPEEQELLDSVERGEWKTTDNNEEEIAFAKEAAENFIRKDERVTLRLSSGDLDRLKQKAAYKGLPYQTFIASILHEYAAGHFIEVDSTQSR
jgi:predicted DNA binding CopG/RHH family protein